jgi:hypothetical protein
MKKGIFYRKFPYGENVYVLASVLSQNFGFGRTSFGENSCRAKQLISEGKI